MKVKMILPALTEALKSPQARVRVSHAATAPNDAIICDSLVASIHMIAAYA